MSSKLYKLALWYIRKWHATDRSYRQEVEKMEWLTYKNCGKAHLIYGLGAEWESIGRYEVIDNAIQRLWEYENKQNEQPQVDKWIPIEEDMPMIDEYALVQDDEERIFIACIDSLDGEWRTNCRHVLRRGSVIAWQPLPQSYKRGVQNNGTI